MNVSPSASLLLTGTKRRTAALRGDSEGSRGLIHRPSYRTVRDALRRPLAGRQDGTDDAVASRRRTVLDK